MLSVFLVPALLKNPVCVAHAEALPEDCLHYCSVKASSPDVPCSNNSSLDLNLVLDGLRFGQTRACASGYLSDRNAYHHWCMQRLIESMDSMNLDAFVYPGWGNPPRLIGDLSQAGNTALGTQYYPPCMHAFWAHACFWTH